MMETAERMVCLPQVSASVQKAVQLFHSVGCALIIHEGHEAIGQSLAYTLLSQRRKRLYYCITPTPPNDRSSDPIEGEGRGCSLPVVIFLFIFTSVISPYFPNRASRSCSVQNLDKSPVRNSLRFISERETRDCSDN